MILESITLSGWRCFIEPVTAGPFSPGLNVVHAPNGTGKSTLLEALSRALFDNHKAGGEEVRALRPWGRELPPRVEVVFLHDGAVYRIVKQFAAGQYARLDRRDDGRFAPLAEGEAADDRVRELLAAKRPGRGLSRQEHWGVAQALWAPQGNLKLEGLSDDLTAAVRAVTGAQLEATGRHAVEKRIEDKYLEYFTPKGKAKANTSLTQLESDLEKAQEERARFRDLQQEYESCSRQVEDLRAAHAQLKSMKAEFAAAASKARDEAQLFQRLQGQREQCQGRAEAAEARYAALEQTYKRIVDLEQSAARARRELAAVAETQASRDLERQTREREAAEAQAALEDVRREREAVEAAAAEAEQARQYLECLSALARQEAKIAAAQETEALIAAAEKERSAVIAPDARTLSAIQKALREQESASAQLRAAMITLEIVPERDGRADVLAGMPDGERVLIAGVPTVVQGAPEAVVHLPGIARLRAAGPAGSIEERLAQEKKAAQTLASLTAPFHTEDIDLLEARREKAQAMETRLAALRAQFDAQREGKDMQTLRAECASLGERRDVLLERFPGWDREHPDAERLKARAETLKTDFIERVEAAETRRQTAQETLSVLREQLADARRRMQHLQERLSQDESELTRLTADGQSLDARRQAMTEQAMAADAAKEQRRRIEAQLNAYDFDPDALSRRLEGQLQDIEADALKRQQEELRAEAHLAHLAARAPYAGLAAAEEQTASLEEKLRREQRRVLALKLLYDTIQTCRGELFDAVIQPVQEAATRLYHGIAGRRHGPLRLGDGFAPVGVAPESREEAVALENLSGGEQEQIHLAVRLALGRMLSAGGRELTVLDDALSATDTYRMARIMDILEAEAERQQILVLTCHPERYRALRHAAFFDLEALKRAT